MPQASLFHPCLFFFFLLFQKYKTLLDQDILKNILGHLPILFHLAVVDLCHSTMEGLKVKSPVETTQAISKPKATHKPKAGVATSKCQEETFPSLYQTGEGSS